MTWAAYETPLKAYVDVSGSSEDANLQLWLAAAVDAADRFMNNPFDATDDLSPSTLPDVVILGVYEYVRLARSVLGSTGKGLGVKSAKTGDLSEAYVAGGSSRAINVAAVADSLSRAVQGFWRSWIYQFTR